MLGCSFWKYFIGDSGDDDLDGWKLVAFIRHLPQLSEQEQMETEHLNPKGPDEMQKEMEEEQLDGSGGTESSAVEEMRLVWLRRQVDEARLSLPFSANSG